ncbi:hypothetical protein, partial [Streptomyces brasiliensis]|uniref:hypothetical protein n=1 Tax=Streptomyces brasiliensis TaxID=1954 RepID=UPI001E4C4EAF
GRVLERHERGGGRMVKPPSANPTDRLARPHDPRDEVDDVWEERVQCHACAKSYVAIEMDRDPTVGHAAICASCASSAAFLAAARAERGSAPRLDPRMDGPAEAQDPGVPAL